MRKWNYNTNTGISITSIVIIIIITNPQRYKKENKILKSHNEMKTNFFKPSTSDIILTVPLLPPGSHDGVGPHPRPQRRRPPSP